MTPEQKAEFINAGFTEEDIDTIEHINQQMTDMFRAINKEAGKDESEIPPD
jgi:hypothetical protein